MSFFIDYIQSCNFAIWYGQDMQPDPEWFLVSSCIHNNFVRLFIHMLPWSFQKAVAAPASKCEARKRQYSWKVICYDHFCPFTLNITHVLTILQGWQEQFSEDAPLSSLVSPVPKGLSVHDCSLIPAI